MGKNGLSGVVFQAAVWAVSVWIPIRCASAATNDVTGLTPTLAMTFDNSSVVNDNGSGTLSSVNGEGTTSFAAAPNGKAINTALFTPYGNLSGVTTAGSSFSVSAYATLGANANGILLCLRDSTAGSVILRRGATADTAVLTLGNATTAVLTASGIFSADVIYHHYALVFTVSNTTLYVDGVAKGTTNSTATAYEKIYYQFGSRHGGVLTGEAKNGGRLDDLRIYNSALTVAQIQSLCASLTSASAATGAISIKTGVRGDAAIDGNVSLFSALTLGAVPTAAATWNKTPNWSNNGAGMAGAVTNLYSSEMLSGAKLYYTFANTYLNGASTNTANGTLTRTYFDDGTAASYKVVEGVVTNVLPDPGITRGWEVMLTNVPFQNADLYVIIGSDQGASVFLACPVLVKVGDSAWTNYYGLPGMERTAVGSQTWPGAVYSSGTLSEGNHYVRIQLSNLTTNTAIAIAHGVRYNPTGNTRIGLAGLQLVKRDSAVDTSDDPFYLRTVAGTTNWTAAAWTNKGTAGNNWSDSTTNRKTVAVLTTSGTTSVVLPDAGATAEVVSVKGSGAFTLAGPGGLTLNGGSIIDTYGMQATDVVNIAAALMGSNVTLAANNASAAGLGYTRLGCATNSYAMLTVTKGTLAANTPLPPTSGLTLNGGSLLFTSSGAITNPVTLSADAKVRVLTNLTAEISSSVTGSNSVTKSDTGTLVLSGGGSFKNLLWENTGTVRLAGTSPFSLSDTTGNGYASSLEVATPVALSGRLSLGAVTLPLAAGGTITASALRWCDMGAYNTTANQTGGRIVVTGSDNSIANTCSLLFAHWAGTMNYSLSGGEFLATNAVAMMSWDGQATWTISGSGRAYVNGVNMKGHASANYSKLILSGGTLEVGGSGLFASDTSSSRTIELNTGTLRAWSNFTVAASAVSNAVSLKDAATGVTLDPNGKTVTWSAPLSGIGKLVINDSSSTAGQVRLMAASTHAGGTDVRTGTLAVGNASALGTGPLALATTLDVGAVDAACGAMTVTNPVTLKVRLGMEADLSGSGSLSPATLTIACDATNAVQVVLDLNGINTPLAGYPLILSSSIPADALAKMTVAFSNGGSGLLPTAAVALERRADGIYAVFTGVIPPKNLFWRNGVSSGLWTISDAYQPWGADSVSGASTNYTSIDTVNFTDTDQPTAAVTVSGSVAPVHMNLTNSATAYTFVADAGGATLDFSASALTKRGSGNATFGMPVSMNSTLTVEGGTLALNAPFGVVATAAFSNALSVAANAVLSFGGSATQTLSGALSGAGTLRVTAGRLKIGASGAALSGDMVASGGVLELSVANGFLTSAARFRVDAGATCELTALDASGYDVTNSKPLDIYGTLKVLQRDSTARGIKLHNGALVLLKGSGMDSGHAMDLFNTPTISLDAGAASFLPLDANDATQATIIVRTENMVKTFDVQSSNAVLTMATPLIGGITGNILDKVGPGTLRWTGANTTVAKLRVSAGAFEIGDSGSLGAGASAQEIEIAAGSVFRYASTANQTLSGLITCSGSFAKSGSGRLAFSGTLTVNVGGELAVPAVSAAEDAVSFNGSTFTVNGVVRVSNVGSLIPGKTYTLLTSAQTLPTDIATKVAGLPDFWRTEITDGGKTLIVYKKMGLMIRIK